MDTNRETYVIVTEENGEDYFCPATETLNRQEIVESESCVDAATVGRYAGNIVKA